MSQGCNGFTVEGNGAPEKKMRIRGARCVSGHRFSDAAKVADLNGFSRRDLPVPAPWLKPTHFTCSWRHALKAAQPGASMGRFARVDVATYQQPLPDIPIPPPGLVEIALPNGITVRIDAGIDPRALRRVLAALRG